MATGRVRDYDATKGLGHILPDTGGRVTVNFKEVSAAGLQALKPGQKLAYEPHQTRNGTIARALKPL